MSDQRIRVLVVEDSLTIRKHMVEVLASDPRLEVVGEAADGKRAIELCQSLRPNVITMDMMLPVMTGVAATEYIMAYCPTPILIVSSSTNRGELFRTYDALAAGAIDVLDKPRGTEPDHIWEKGLVDAVRMVAKIRPITHPRAKLSTLAPISIQPAATSVSREREAPAISGGREVTARGASTSGRDARITIPPGERRVIALGVSTGGPAALRTILSSLPKNFPLPILVVLHISEMFAQAMCEWLDAQMSLEVRYAIDGEKLPARGHGCVLMAAADRHLEVESGRLRLTAGPERHSCRPSVDVLFESLAREMGPQTVAGVLTGIGRDGAKGLLAIRNSGGLTLAQDEESSVVFGMPAEAIKLGAASHILSLDEIGPVLQRAVLLQEGKETKA